MPVIKLYNNGLVIGISPSKNNHKRGLRGQTSGWSKSSSRSNTCFLYSVVSEDLDGDGFAFTFTVRDLPPTPEHWETLRRKLLKRFKRMGLVRLHWLTEWQRRGVPHLHGCIYFDHALDTNEYQSITKHWLQAAAEYRPTSTGQNIKPITSAIGWLEYLSKHAARGVYHYQRNGKPKSWEKTGRMWGKSGKWPTLLSEVHLDKTRKNMAIFWRFRRLARNWRIADARKPQYVPIQGLSGRFVAFVNGRRISSARKCLKQDGKGLSSVRGMSEWIPYSLGLKILAFLSAD